MQLENAPAVIGFRAALVRAVRLGFRLRGRASRPEFWYFFVAYVPLVLTLGVVESVVDEDWLYTAATLLYLPWLVPFVCVGVRRLHDTGRSGWWCVGVIGCLGWIVLTVLWSKPGQPGPNRHGPPPR
ncbi:DUF805 domain-containing protein [Amycolatopsis sp. NPDC004772]